MIALNEYQKHIDKLEITDWNRLFDFLTKIELSESFGEWKTLEKDSDGFTQFPYVINSRLVDEFCELMYELELVVVFDWAKWEYGKKIIESGNYENQDTVTLLMVLTTFIRPDRFTEGYLDDKFNDGTVEKVLKELKKNIKVEVVR